MKLTASSTDLLKHLNVAAGAIGGAAVLPILEDFLFTIRKKVLTISASDLETSISTTMEVVADEDFQVAIPGKILLDTLKALPTQPITISVDADTNGVDITSSYGKYRMAGEDAADYPSFPAEEGVASISVNSDVLASAIEKTAFAASTDELRPAMTGVYFQIEKSKLVCVATDAHKLVRFTSNQLTGDAVASFIIPRKTLNLLKNALPAGQSVQVAFNKGHAFFSWGTVHIVTRLIDAKFPDYNAIIPVNNADELIVQRKDLLSSLKRISIFSNKTTNQVFFAIADKEINLRTQDIDFQNEANETLASSYAGEQQFEIAFNAKFLIEILGVMDTDEIKLNMNGASRPVILTDTAGNGDYDLMMLVMPVMVY
jgi:DNA polymerase III subunit beta